MAIDYGTKRVGLAVTDPSRIIATPLDTVLVHELMPYLKSYHEREAIERFVVGEPRKMDNSPSEITPQIERFILHLQKSFPGIPIDRVDERFTSRMAQQAILDSGLKKQDRRKKELVDQTSAVLILQSWMATNGL
jgi:putative Holliday junction resolvase